MTDQIKISMFNVGFGDCFLVEIPLDAKTCRILFDCGRHLGGTPENQQLADRVIAAASDAPGRCRIDLIVATHRHKDHVSGFAANGWDTVEVGEVWMPWTENPDDSKARGLVERQVAAATQAAKLAPELTGLTDLLRLALTNEAAMSTLYHGFSGGAARRYLPDPAAPTTALTLKDFPRIRFHVMGPPHDEAALASMDPPKAETFRRLTALAQGGGTAALVPFGPKWQCAPAADVPLSQSDRTTIERMSDGADLEGVATLIDNAINNTSLVIMIEIGAAFLLFCADAQWGNWQSILAQPQWRDLLARTTFLKVGHHASHNASPVTLIDKLLPPNIAAMVSTDPHAYSNVPYAALLTEFDKRAFKVARSDDPAAANAHGYQADQVVTTALVPF